MVSSAIAPSEAVSVIEEVEEEEEFEEVEIEEEEEEEEEEPEEEENKMEEGDRGGSRQDTNCKRDEAKISGPSDGLKATKKMGQPLGTYADPKNISSEEDTSITKNHGGAQVHGRTYLSKNNRSIASDLIGEKQPSARLMREESIDNRTKALMYPEVKTEQVIQQPEKDVDLRASSFSSSLPSTRSLSPGAESENRSKRPAMVCDFFSRGWCIKGSSCRFRHVKDGAVHGSLLTEDMDVEKLKTENQTDPGSREDPEKSGNNLLPDLEFRFFPSSMTSSSIYRSSSSPSSYGRTEEKFASLKETKSLGTNKFLESYGGYCASTPPSLPQSSFSSFYSKYGLESFPQVGAAGLPFVSASSKSQSYKYCWEPSIPFRSSFHLPPYVVTSPERQYDSLLDGIEKPVGEDRISQSSSFSQQGMIRSADKQAANPALAANSGQEVDAGHSSGSAYPHYNSGDKVLNWNAYTHEAANHRNEDADISINDQGYRMSMPKEEKRSPAIVLNAPDHSSVHPSLGNKHKKELVTRRDRNHNKKDSNHSHRDRADGTVQIKESRALKVFRASLIDFTKELVKPAWQECRLSKEDHKTIVRKAVEKILSTLEPHQIPSSMDLVNQYLTSSKTKISKLVEGYIDKYTRY